MGAEAVLALMDATPKSSPVVVSLVGNKTVRVPLMECVKITQEVATAMAEHNWELVIQLRGPSFKVCPTNINCLPFVVLYKCKKCRHLALIST